MTKWALENLMLKFSFHVRVKTILFSMANPPGMGAGGGCLHDTRMTFIPVRIHPGSLVWLFTH